MKGAPGAERKKFGTRPKRAATSRSKSWLVFWWDEPAGKSGTIDTGHILFLQRRMRRSQYAHAPGYNLDTWPGPSLVKIAHIGTAQGAVKVGRINDVAVLSRHRSRVMGVAFEMTAWLRELPIVSTRSTKPSPRQSWNSRDRARAIPIFCASAHCRAFARNICRTGRYAGALKRMTFLRVVTL